MRRHAPESGGDLAQERLVGLGELVGLCRQAGRDPGQLRERQREEADGELGERPLTGVDLRRQRARGLILHDPLAQPRVRRSPLRSLARLGRRPFERFPHQQADVLAGLGVERRAVHPAVGDVGALAGHVRQAVGERAQQHRLEQSVLAAEVVVQHPLVHTRPAGDRVDAGAADALGSELARAAVQDPGPRALWVAYNHVIPFTSWVADAEVTLGGHEVTVQILAHCNLWASGRTVDGGRERRWTSRRSMRGDGGRWRCCACR